MYPKTKIKRNKLKLIINTIIDNIKNILFTCLKIISSKEYFIIFMRKCFHF